MEAMTAPYRQDLRLAKFKGEWTQEQIANGEAGEPEEVIVTSTWYEADGAEVTDPARIAELELKALEASGHG